MLLPLRLRFVQLRAVSRIVFLCPMPAPHYASGVIHVS